MTMADRHLPHPAHTPLWRRLSRWLGAANRTGRARSSGLDSARLDLGYEAAYAPALADSVGAPSRFEDDRASH